jgi:hypothetical protein
MDNKLNYQQARTVRKQSLRDVIADELIRGRGFGSAVTGAIGLKTQARIKGIKEKFDPLNIVKFLTFGSRLGPALYGKLFGRSKKDIEYFTGRAKPIGRKDQKLNKDGTDDEEDTAGMKTVLKQILTFMKKTHEQDVLLREEENNLKESNKLNDEKRHKELLKALGAVGTQQPTAKAVPVKEKESGFLQNIMQEVEDTVQGIKDKIQKTIDDLEERIKGFTEKLGALAGLEALSWMPKQIVGGVAIFASFVALSGFLMKLFQDLISADTNRRIDEFARKGDIDRTRAAIQSRNRLEDWSAMAINGGTQPDYDEAGTEMKTRDEIKKQADLGFPEAIKALARMDAEKQSKKDEYIKSLNLPADKPLNNAQERDAELYSLGMIDIKGGYNPSDEERKFYQDFMRNFKNWAKDAPGEKERDEFFKNAAKERLLQNWRMLTAPGHVTEDDIMVQKMFEVMKQNPFGPWNFDKTIPGYNEYLKRKDERQKQSQSALETVNKLAELDQKQQEANDLKNSISDKEMVVGKNTTAQPTMVSSVKKQGTQNQNIPMPLSRLIEQSYVVATESSFA